MNESNKSTFNAKPAVSYLVAQGFFLIAHVSIDFAIFLRATERVHRDKRDSNLRDKSTKNEWFERKSRLKSLILRAIIELNDFIVARLSFLDFIWQKKDMKIMKTGDVY